MWIRRNLKLKNLKLKKFEFKSHSSFFFTIGITLHKSSYAQYHDKSILYLGSVPTVCFVKAWDRSHWSFFNIIGTTRQKKSYWQSHYKSISHLGSVPTVYFHKGLGSVPLVIFLYHWDNWDKSSYGQYKSISNLIGSVPTVCLIKAWDQSHSSFFFTIGTTHMI